MSNNDAAASNIQYGHVHGWPDFVTIAVKKADRHLAIRLRTRPDRHPSIFDAVTDGHGFTAFRHL